LGLLLGGWFDWEEMLALVLGLGLLALVLALGLLAGALEFLLKNYFPFWINKCNQE